MLTRRQVLSGLLAAPAIVRCSSLMALSPIRRLPPGDYTAKIYDFKFSPDQYITHLRVEYGAISPGWLDLFQKDTP